VFTESWGPVWRLAAQAGLPPYGPLILPGSWMFE
jgi:protease-4